MGHHDKSTRTTMLAAVPSLRAFAISLCGNVDRADDLVQEALLRAWGNLDSFEPGTNMSAWLFTILRNVFLKGSPAGLMAGQVAALAIIAAVSITLATRAFQKRLQ